MTTIFVSMVMSRSMEKISKGQKKNNNSKNVKKFIKFIASSMPFTICNLNEPFMSYSQPKLPLIYIIHKMFFATTQKVLSSLKLLQSSSEPKSNPWTIFHKNLRDEGVRPCTICRGMPPIFVSHVVRTRSLVSVEAHKLVPTLKLTQDRALGPIAYGFLTDTNRVALNATVQRWR